MLTVARPVCETDGVGAFKERTLAKLDGVSCPVHCQAPRVQFNGASLREITISMSGCCNQLLEIANRAIASVR